MAKKGQVVQLHVDVNTDEDWEKLLTKEGLIVVDVYSEWCGPCSGMAGNLKKLKLELGGDMLTLALAKSDTISDLARFRNKSEPTWMIISNGKMVNFMFGANAPKLTRIIIEELKKDAEFREGKTDRLEIDISELAEEERERQDVIDNIMRQTREIEEAKKAKELLERRTLECQNILENMPHLGVILVFPQARNKYMEVISDLMSEAAVVISLKEKINLTEEVIEELFMFEDEIDFDEDEMEILLSRVSLMLLIKPAPRKEIADTIENVLAELVYGASKNPPGDPECATIKLQHLLSEEVEQQHEKDVEPEPILTALWTPRVPETTATALRLFFPKKIEHYMIPEPEPPPEHYTVIFDAFRKLEVAELMDTYPEQIMHYGFFTSAIPEDAEVIAKSIYQYQKKPRVESGKLVIQLSKKKSECTLAFAQLKPFYMSPNTMEGKRECKIFFPEEYDEVLEEEEANALQELSLKEIASGGTKKAIAEEEEKKIVGEEEKIEGDEEVVESSEVPEGAEELAERGGEEEGNVEHAGGEDLEHAQSSEPIEVSPEAAVVENIEPIS